MHSAYKDMSKQDKAAKDGNNGKDVDMEMVAPLELLDEYWFFNNTLKGRKKEQQPSQRPPLLPKSPSQSKCRALHEEGRAASTPTRFSGTAGPRRLLRTPSLPPPCVSVDVEEDGVEEEEEEEGDLNWSSIYEGVLRNGNVGGGGGGGRSTLLRAPSMPLPTPGLEEDGRHDDETTVVAKPSLPKLRYSYSSLEGHCRSNSPLKVHGTATTQQQASEHSDRTPRGIEERRRWPRQGIRSFSDSHQPLMMSGGGYYNKKSGHEEKKWKSSSDLESIEVQGFKDLGFVFDREELKESLARVLPGLRGKKEETAADGGGNVRRPYLSEAWRAQGSAPPAIRLADKRSAPEVKEQIRLWAQAVACNVRQDC